MNRHLKFPGATALVLGLSAAGGRSYSAATVSGPCELITREEAAKALGAAVPAGTAKSMDLPLEGSTIRSDVCFYGSEVMVVRYELGTGAASLFDRYRKSLLSESGYLNVTGLGDEAFAAKGQLYARKGQSGIIVDVGQARGGGAKELQAEKGLMNLAIGRM